MRAVVVVAHPNPDSFTHAIAATAVRSLGRAGHDVEVFDLYAAGFRAAMSPDERRAYHGDQPVLDPMVAEHIEAVLAADTLVFVYPNWWSSMPAVLKGWLERVMVADVGFRFDDQHRVRPALTNVRRIVGICTYGSSRLMVKAVNDNGRRTITRALRLSTGWRTRTKWIAMYRADASTPDQRSEFLAAVDRKVGSL
jgi:putative NADPH-quinone reductase